jgi:hypothetical protein
LAIDPDYQDTMTTFSFYTEDYFLDESYCTCFGFTDLSLTMELNTLVGLSGTWNWYNPSEYHSIVIASRVGGVETGDIHLGERELQSGAMLLSIHPNPATDRIFLRGPRRNGAPYTLLDGLGRIIKNGTLADADGGISVKELPQGIYILRLFQGNGVQSARFVKE